MTGRELIDFIESNHLEDYRVVTTHETGDAPSVVRQIEIDDESKDIELF